MIGRIALPTDFSELSTKAFEHALRLALAAQCSIDLLHVKSARTRQDWESFPHVRETLARWGVLDANATTGDIAAKAGVIVRKAEINHDKGPAAGIFEYIAKQPADMIVTAPHDHNVLGRWVSGSVSEEIALRTHRPTLFVGERMTPFVDTATGSIKLSNVLVPIDHQPNPDRVIEYLTRFFDNLKVFPDFTLLHVGDEPPILLDDMDQEIPVIRAAGSVAQAILEHAETEQADLIAMPTAGHDGFLDVLRGSTTERVMRHVHCPLLAIPAQSFKR